MVGCLAGGRDDAIYAPLNEGGGCFLPCGKFDFSFGGYSCWISLIGDSGRENPIFLFSWHIHDFPWLGERENCICPVSFFSTFSVFKSFIF